MRILRQLPNLLTLLRLVMTLPIGWLLLEQRYAAALLWFALAGASDALDGFLARRFGWVSHFGSIIDPLADKLLLVTSYLCLGIAGAIPLWLVAVVLGRDLLLVGGAILYRSLRGPFRISPSWLGKLSTLLQILLILALLLQMSIQPSFVEVQRLFQWLVLLATLASGVDYCRVWIGKFTSQSVEPGP